MAEVDIEVVDPAGPEGDETQDALRFGYPDGAGPHHMTTKEGKIFLGRVQSRKIGKPRLPHAADELGDRLGVVRHRHAKIDAVKEIGHGPSVGRAASGQTKPRPMTRRDDLDPSQ
jgi:hypothetical protein